MFKIICKRNSKILRGYNYINGRFARLLNPKNKNKSLGILWNIRAAVRHSQESGKS